MKSMQETRKLIQERLVRGNGRLLERLGQPSDLPESQLLNDYLRRISHAVEVFSIPNGTEAVREMQEAVNHQPGVQGWQILEACRWGCGYFYCQYPDPEPYRST